MLVTPWGSDFFERLQGDVRYGEASLGRVQYAIAAVGQPREGREPEAVIAKISQESLAEMIGHDALTTAIGEGGKAVHASGAAFLFFQDWGYATLRRTAMSE
jgi:hypothetical protein